MISTNIIGDAFSPSTYDGNQIVASSTSFGNSASTGHLVLQDSEFKRKARNNAILSKIQELEANASIHAARSERFRLMREEYEALVRRYASNRQWSSGQGSYFNGIAYRTNGYHQNCAERTDREGTQQNPHPSRESQVTTYGTLVTTGINTDISGPVKPISLGESGTENDLLQRTDTHAEVKKVRVIVDAESQTRNAEQSVGHFGENRMTVILPQRKRPEALSSSSGNFIYDGREKPNQKAIEKSGEDQIKQVSSTMSTFKTSKNLSTNKMGMMMSMMLEDEGDDDESLLEKHERKRKLQLREFHQQPKAISHGFDDSGSIITSEEGTDSKILSNADNRDFPKTSHTTADEGLLKVGQRQKQDPMMEKKTTTERLEVMLEKSRSKEDEDSVEDSTFANDRKGAGANDGGVGGLTDPSFSESVSVFQRHEVQRKKLLQEIGDSLAKNVVKQKGKLGTDDTDSESSGNEEKSVKARKYHVEDDDDELDQEDDPTTGAGGGGNATSESLGDSFMDSIHKASDMLPKDESELHEIKETKREHGKQAEIKFGQQIPSGNGLTPCSYDDILVVTATAALNQPLNYGLHKEKSELTPSHSEVTDKFSKTVTAIALKRSNLEFEEETYEKEEAIIDVEGTRSDNLSSSKFDKPAGEVENIIDANIFRNNASKENEERKALPGFHDDAEQVEKEDERKFLKSGNGEAIELNKKDMDSYSPAPSANMSAHPSSSSSFISSGFNVLATEGRAKEVNSHENEPPSSPTKQVVQRELSESASSSSSSSYSRHHSLDGKDEASAAAGNSQQPDINDDVPQQTISHDAQMHHPDTSTSPQSTHKRHQQLEEEGQREGDGKETSPPVGAEIMPQDRLSSPFSSTSGMYASANGTKKNAGDKTGKTEKSSASVVQTATNASPSSKRSGVVSDSAKGNGVTGGVSNIRSGTTKSLKSSTVTGIPPKQVAPATVPTGPPGARNTMRRVRLKLNYDDSESDSSEIGPVKVGHDNVKAGEQKSASSIKTSNNSIKNQEPTKETSQKSKEDDDFDDFFDI